MKNAECRKERDGAAGRAAGAGTERGRYSLFKESAGPQRQVGREKNTGPLYIREFVAFICTKRRDKRRGLGWEVMDWQVVTDFEESAQNYFGRILLP